MEKKREADEDGGLAERQDLEDDDDRDESQQRAPPPFPPQNDHRGTNRHQCMGHRPVMTWPSGALDCIECAGAEVNLVGGIPGTRGCQVAPPQVCDPGRSPDGRLPVHRGLLQSPSQALVSRIPPAGQLRKEDGNDRSPGKRMPREGGPLPRTPPGATRPRDPGQKSKQSTVHRNGVLQH